MEIDHIGVVVRSIEKAIPHWEKVFGYYQDTEIIENTRQLVRVSFLKKDNSLTIKLIEPTCPESPAASALKKGQTLHHLCFKCENLKEEMARQKNLGSRILVPPQPGEAFENEDIAFVFAGLGLNVEIIDTEKRAGKIQRPG